MNHSYLMPPFELNCTPLFYCGYPIDPNAFQTTTKILPPFYHLLDILSQYDVINYQNVAYYLQKTKLDNDNAKEEPQIDIKEAVTCHLKSTQSPHNKAEYLEGSVKYEMSPKQEYICFDSTVSKNKVEQERAEYLLKLRNRNTVQTEDIKAQLQDMIFFFMKRVECLSPQGMELQRQKYAHNRTLLCIFEILNKKYAASGKTREDMTRFCIRKALTFLRKFEKNHSNLNVKDANLVLVQRYFPRECAKLLEKGGRNIEQKLEALLPYKKNSINKTPNTEFITQLFTSEAFCKDYIIYLAHFEQIMETGNQKKIDNLVHFLYVCAKQRQLEKIEGYKRLPWMDAWVRSTKTVAEELLEKTIQIRDFQLTDEFYVNKKKFKK